MPAPRAPDPAPFFLAFYADAARILCRLRTVAHHIFGRLLCAASSMGAPDATRGGRSKLGNCSLRLRLVHQGRSI
jgi:hypothetical protein